MGTFDPAMLMSTDCLLVATPVLLQGGGGAGGPAGSVFDKVPDVYGDLEFVPVAASPASTEAVGGGPPEGSWASTGLPGSGAAADSVSIVLGGDAPPNAQARPCSHRRFVACLQSSSKALRFDLAIQLRIARWLSRVLCTTAEAQRPALVVRQISQCKYIALLCGGVTMSACHHRSVLCRGCRPRRRPPRRPPPLPAPPPRRRPPPGATAWPSLALPPPALPAALHRPLHATAVLRQRRHVSPQMAPGIGSHSRGCRQWPAVRRPAAALRRSAPAAWTGLQLRGRSSARQTWTRPPRMKRRRAARRSQQAGRRLALTLVRHRRSSRAATRHCQMPQAPRRLRMRSGRRCRVATPTAGTHQ